MVLDEGKGKLLEFQVDSLDIEFWNFLLLPVHLVNNYKLLAIIENDINNGGDKCFCHSFFKETHFMSKI